MLKKPTLVILYTGFLLYISLVSQAFVFTEVFLCWLVTSTGIAIIFLRDSLEFCKKKYHVIANFRFNFISTALIFLFSILFSYKHISNYLISENTDNGQLVDRIEIQQALKAHDKNIHLKTLMSVHPARAYYVESSCLIPPLHYSVLAEDLVNYNFIDKKIKVYAPKYPSSMSLEHLQADYLVYDTSLQRMLPQYSFLLSPEDASVPSNFIPVFVSENSVVYKIVTTRAQKKLPVNG